MKTLLLIIVSCFLGSELLAQDTLSTPILIDSTESIDSSISDSRSIISAKKVLEPKRAALYSLVLPGAGQIYNGRWWKVPLVYGGLGTTIYLIDYNRDFYLSLKQAYINRQAGLEDAYDGSADALGFISSAEGIQNARDQFRKDMELAYFATAGVYLLQVLEAYIDAHLQGFDVDEVLTFKMSPSRNGPLDPTMVKVGLFIQL